MNKRKISIFFLSIPILLTTFYVQYHLKDPISPDNPVLPLKKSSEYVINEEDPPELLPSGYYKF
jgi:hypothetical protein